MKLILFLFFGLFFIIDSYAQSAWLQKPNVPAVGRHRGIGFSVGNKGYIGLGHYDNTSGDIILSDIWEYDPSSNSWTQKADFGGGGSYAATAFTIGNKAYVGSGTGPFTYPFYEFDPISNQWTQIALPPFGGLDCQSFSANGKGYFITYSGTYEYDPVSDSWATKIPPPITGMNWFSAFGINDKGYLLYPNGNGFFEYDPIVDEYIPKTDFPGLASPARLLAFVCHDVAYLSMGLGSTWLKQVWAYNPLDDSWTQKEDFPASWRRFLAGFSIGDKGYIGTGTTGTNLNDFWEFNSILAIDNPTPSLEIKLFPNPAIEQITIEIDNSGSIDYELEIYSIDGKKVGKFLISNSKLNIYRDQLGSGTFIYTVSFGESTIKTGKFCFLP